MATEKIQIKFEATGLKELQAQVKETIRLMKQLQKEQKKVKIK